MQFRHAGRKCDPVAAGNRAGAGTTFDQESRRIRTVESGAPNTADAVAIAGLRADGVGQRSRARPDDDRSASRSGGFNGSARARLEINSARAC